VRLIEALERVIEAGNMLPVLERERNECVEVVGCVKVDS